MVVVGVEEERASHLPHDHERGVAGAARTRRLSCRPHCLCLQQSLPLSLVLSLSLKVWGETHPWVPLEVQAHGPTL